MTSQITWRSDLPKTLGKVLRAARRERERERETGKILTPRGSAQSLVLGLRPQQIASEDEAAKSGIRGADRSGDQQAASGIEFRRRRAESEGTVEGRLDPAAIAETGGQGSGRVE